MSAFPSFIPPLSFPRGMLSGFRLAVLLTVISCLSVSAQSRSGAPPSFDALSAKADAARDADDLDQAVALYKRALTLHPKWAEGWWSLGTIYYDRSAYPDAAHAFQRLIATDPNNGAGQLMLGLCQFELGQDEAALQNLQAGHRFGVVQDPQLRRVVLYHEGLLLLRQHKFSSAQKALTLLAREDVEDQNAPLALGMSVLLIPPADVPPEGSTGREIILRVGRAETLGVAEKLDEAKKMYASAIEMGKDFPNLHYAYGRFLLEFHEADEALAQFQEEIQNNRGHVQSYLEIAAVNYQVDSAAGVQYAEKAVRLDPSAPFGHYLLGLLYLDTGEYEKSVAELEIARKSFLDKPEVYFALGAAYARLGRGEDAARARDIFKRLSAQNEQATPDTYGNAATSLQPPQEPDNPK